MGLVACLPLFLSFCSAFMLFAPAFCPCVLVFAFRPALVVLCSLCVLVVVSFSLSDYADKKKGRKGFAPCVLSCPIVCVQILVQLSKNSLAVYFAFSSSSGW